MDNGLGLRTSKFFDRTGDMERPEGYSGKCGQQKDMRTRKRRKDTKWAMGPAENVNYATYGLERLRSRCNSNFSSSPWYWLYLALAPSSPDWLLSRSNCVLGQRGGGLASASWWSEQQHPGPQWLAKQLCLWPRLPWQQLQFLTLDWGWGMSN